MLFSPRAARLAPLALVLASCGSPSSGTSTPHPVGLHPGVTSASMLCNFASGAATDPRVNLSCNMQANGPAPPPTLRLALVWLKAPSSVVIELGERSTVPAPFDLPLAIPPDAAIVPSSGPGSVAVAVGRYTLYDDGNGNGALDLGTPATGFSPDRVLAAARHLILYYPGGGGFQIEESTPQPAPDDCVKAPCFTPPDHGSALMGPDTKIELVPIGPVTSQELACDPAYGDSPYESTANGPSGVPPYCPPGAPPAGSGVICQYNGLGDMFIETSCPPLAACGQLRSCTWCIIPAATYDSHPKDSPCSVLRQVDGGFQ